MGLLDDLEKEAERLREEEARKAGSDAQREQAWTERLEPAMRELEAYLKRLTESLKLLKKRIRAVYTVNGYGEVVVYIDPAFVVRTETGSRSIDVIVEMVGQVATEECPLVVADTLTRAKTLSSILQQHRLAGMFDASKNANGEVTAAKFQARGKIPMQLTVHADQESGVARFSFKNMEGFGQSARQFPAEQMSAELFDALGRFLTREDSGFAQESLGENVRRELQSKLQREQAKREWESRLAVQLVEDEAKVLGSLDASLRPGLLGGLRRLLGR
ncbi:hypothetical protein [Pseudomarimonas salicorniae]|uniref:Uncharacterized protein n=1 Tax=Pseudomarimonas salicorniae TaxID=2933270 RepID=A0ABT0GHJ7_9GAMM|nr:hypothetical protein [Lysobacter sp. CAU 1642]MCK7594022.1 hypothetical protein [Lysobacter sp. CAU 1642]